MMPRIIGLALAIAGLCISQFYKVIIRKILKKQDFTDADVLRVKFTGLAVAVCGGLVAMLLG